MKKISSRAFAVFVFFMFLGSASQAWCQTSSVVSGNIPQDESRLRQDEIQLQDNESAGDIHAVAQDEAYLHAQQNILINDENSVQSFANLSKQYQDYQSQSNEPYTAYQNHSQNNGQSNNRYQGHDYGPSGYSGSEGSGAISENRQAFTSPNAPNKTTSSSHEYNYRRMASYSRPSAQQGWNSSSTNHGWGNNSHMTSSHSGMTSPHILGTSIGAGTGRQK